MSKSLDSESKPLLEDSTYNVIHQLKKKADFLYSAVEEYIRDADKDNKPELLKLRKELVREAKEDKFR